MSKAAKRERQRLNREARRESELAAAKRRQMTRRILTIGLPILLIFGIIFVVSNLRKDDKKNSNSSPTSTTPAAAPATGECTLPAMPELQIDPSKSYAASVQTSEGAFEIALDSKQAPLSVNAFVYEARNGCYDGLTFSRVAKDFVIQGGDSKGDGSGDFGYQLPDEPPENGYAAFDVALANAGPGTSGSQFFVALGDQGAQKLGSGGPPYKYSILGKVTSGMEVVTKIGGYYPATQGNDGPPTTAVTITTITISEDGAPLGKTVPTSTTAPAASAPADSSAPEISTPASSEATPNS